MDPSIEEFRQHLIDQSPVTSETTEVDVHAQVVDIAESLDQLLCTLHTMHQSVDNSDVEFQLAVWMGEMAAAQRGVNSFAQYIEDINEAFGNGEASVSGNEDGSA